MKAALPLLALALALAACAPAAKAPPAPVASAPAPRPKPARPAPAPAPVSGLIPDDWMDAATTPGQWRYETILGGTAATFVGNDASALARLRCERGSKTMILALTSAAARSPAVEIRTETQTAALPLAVRDGRAEVVMRGDLPLLDAIALSKGKFAIGAEGMLPLYLPSWAEVSRVIEDCR